MAAYTCPNICPGAKDLQFDTNASGGTNDTLSSSGHVVGPYVPGRIVPPEKKVQPPGAAPLYLPQATDSTSGDILGMSPIDPWAPGHMNWTPQAGMTGVRPVVDKYSITHYSTGEWRKNNKYTLTPRATDKAKNMETTSREQFAKVFKSLADKENDSNTKLRERVIELNNLEKKAKATVNAIADEIDKLDIDRLKLKSACKILMTPEAISRECLELRTHRYEPDLVRDDAEQELIREVAIVGEIRKLFLETLAKVENQMLNNRAAKAAMESDWSDKMVTFTVDGQNLLMNGNSTLIRWHPGVARWPENATSLEYYEHFCNESVNNCEEVRQKSADLRKTLQSIITLGSRDLKTQADRTNAALAETVKSTQGMCKALEDNLKDNLQTVANIEKFIDFLNDSLRELKGKDKLNQTRLQNRNYERPNVENCRDRAQYALMGEAKFIKETTAGLNDKIREAEAIRAELMKYRGELEKDIACKRKSLNLDEDRLARVRAHMPTPEEFANA